MLSAPGQAFIVVIALGALIPEVRAALVTPPQVNSEKGGITTRWGSGVKTPTINSTIPAPARKISGNAGHNIGNIDVIIYQPATVMGWPAATAIS